MSLASIAPGRNDRVETNKLWKLAQGLSSLSTSSEPDDDGVEEYLHDLPEFRRIVIGNDVPNLAYDLLPRELKSHRFRIEFDLVYPYSRFVIIHKFVGVRFLDLRSCEKRELMRTALSFVRKFKLFDAFLTIPLGTASHIGTIYSTFYAYITVPNVEAFLKVVKMAVNSRVIPKWPSNAWLTSQWGRDADLQKDPMSYVRSVRNNVKKFPFTDTKFLLQRHITSFCPEWDTESQVKTDNLCQDIDIVICAKEKKVGVFSNAFIAKRVNELERCQFLDFMEKLVRSHLKKDHKRRCWMNVSLASNMLFRLNASVFAFLQFQHKIPKFIFRISEKKAKKVAIEAEKRQQREEIWVVIDDDTLNTRYVKFIRD